LTIISSDRFVEHQTPPGHPESPARAEVFSVIAGEWRAMGGEVVAPPAATPEQLARVHAADYLQRIQATEGKSVALDPDTYTSPASHEIALLAAGGSVHAVDSVMANGGCALVMGRPPGHHAERNKAMGFCLYNNIAIAAAEARARGAERVAIVDYDVHHGNGTQHIFESDPSVLYMSAHQFPFYPGTGAPEEIGKGAGEGYTINVALEAGAVDEDYKQVFKSLFNPIIRQFKPDLVLVSAGFDAHDRDPLAGMRLTTAAFGAMTNELRLAAKECCRGKLVAVVEGGYDMRALGQSLRAVVNSLSALVAQPAVWPAAGEVAPTRAQAAVEATRRAVGRFWKL
jgi:acetoin utilization deacetylase AcuC-like enzyme